MSDIKDLSEGLKNCDDPIFFNDVYNSYKFSDEVKALLDGYSKEVSNTRKKKIIDNVKDILVEAGICSSSNKSLSDSFLVKLNYFANNDSKLQKLVTGYGTFNQNLHQNIACLVSAILSKDSNIPGKFNKIHNWFRGLKQIGADSVEGYALRASFTTNNELFIVKTSRNPKKDDISHEALVGLYVTNILRKWVPNFMYVYGHTKCSPMLIKNREVQTWCSSNELGVSYLVVENIKNSVPIWKWLQTASYEDFVKVILQIFNALNIAYKYFGFVHHDFHQDNIMVRKFDSPVPVEIHSFTEDNLGRTVGREYVSTNFVPYIIDYGFAEFRIDTHTFKKDGYSEENYPFPGFPMIDCYKFIVNLAREMRLDPSTSPRSMSEKAEKISLLNNIFKFFEEGDIGDVVTESLTPKGNKYLIASKKHQLKTYKQFMEYNDVYTRYFSPHTEKDETKLPQAPEKLSSKFTNCKLYDEAATPNNLRNVTEFLNMITSIERDVELSEDEKIEAKEWANISFNSYSYYLNELKRVNKILKRSKILFGHLRADSIKMLKTDANFIDELNKVVKVISELKELYFELDSFEFLVTKALIIQDFLEEQLSADLDKISNDGKEMLEQINIGAKNLGKARVHLLKLIAGGKTPAEIKSLKKSRALIDSLTNA